MTIVPPRAIRLTADPLENGHYCIEYEEDFEDVDLVARTIGLTKTMENSGIKVSSPNIHTIRIEIQNAPLSQLADMMVGEFMQWATLGQIKVGQLLSVGLGLTTPKGSIQS